ncbi:MAG: CPBP family intramembrane metalloprotease [Phenylobacterium sp.]|uniref:CPBP family intramembrane glutamic endopeptidase n=1 Tax=Phenylobacterium sp. TaxID=1871053 RepID=UPI0011F8BC22|nr:CPBP family intramembrane glutamic endopeptidase [Phenylobacterium sp.]TAJ70904.1 MAG: CPBP family intramembrane metalloprotease [Phenylobacterium sp.]
MADTSHVLADQHSGAPADRTVGSVIVFFVLTVLLTTPFWVLGAVLEVEILPGLPIAALAVVCPATAAFILTWRAHGLPAGGRFLAGAFDVRRIRPKVWWLALVLLSPCVMIAMFLAMRLGGSSIPDPQFAPASAAALFVLFLVAALAEELGWSGFAIGPLQARWGALPGALIVGVVWAIWHYPALAQAHRAVAWIGWWTLATVATRVIIIWLFNNTGRSVFGVAVFHAMTNLGWQLYPVHGSWFDPRINALILAAVALAVVLVWGPATLSSSRARSGAARAGG